MNPTEKELRGLRAHRIKNFAATAGPDNHADELYPEEILLRVTHNGFQWQVIGLLPCEVRKVIRVLRTSLSEQRHQQKPAP